MTARCTATAKGTGQQCRLPPLKGAKTCRVHGSANGRSRAAAKANVDRAKLAVQVMRLGIPVEIDPADALLRSVWEAAGNVAFYRHLVEDMERHHLESAGQTVVTPDFMGFPELHVCVRLYNEERDRLAKFAKAAVDAGIAERQVRVAEQQGEQIATVFVLVLEDPRLKLSLVQQAAMRLVAAEKLRELSA